MQFTIETEKLKKILGSTGIANTATNSIPLLQNFLLRLKDGELVVLGTDKELSLVSKGKVLQPDGLADSVVTEPKDGEVLMDAAKLTFLVEAARDKFVTLTQNESMVEIKSGTRVSQILYTISNEFPELPNWNPEEKFVTANRKTLLEAVQKITHTITDDETRTNLLAVHIEDGKMIASDGKRVGILKYADSVGTVDIPSTAIKSLIRVLDQYDGGKCPTEKKAVAEKKAMAAKKAKDEAKAAGKSDEEADQLAKKAESTVAEEKQQSLDEQAKVLIQQHSNFLFFKIGEDVFSSRTKAVGFPVEKIKSWLKQCEENDLVLTVNKDTLQEKIQGLQATLDEDSQAIKLDISPTEFKLQSKDKLGNMTLDQVPKAQYTFANGKEAPAPFQIYFNSDYILEALRSVESASVTIKMKRFDRKPLPALIVDKDFMEIVTPSTVIF